MDGSTLDGESTRWVYLVLAQVGVCIEQMYGHLRPSAWPDSLWICLGNETQAEVATVRIERHTSLFHPAPSIFPGPPGLHSIHSLCRSFLASAFSISLVAPYYSAFTSEAGLQYI